MCVHLYLEHRVTYVFLFCDLLKSNKTDFSKSVLTPKLRKLNDVEEYTEQVN